MNPFAEVQALAECEICGRIWDRGEKYNSMVPDQEENQCAFCTGNF